MWFRLEISFPFLQDGHLQGLLSRISSRVSVSSQTLRQPTTTVNGHTRAVARGIFL